MILIKFKINFRFKEHAQEKNWIHINTQRGGCRSRVGRKLKGKKQVVYAKGCLDPNTGGSWGKLLHECMHALGLCYYNIAVTEQLK